jgi:hypothetical protein
LSPLVDTLRPPEPPWTEVGRICRRICILRWEGRDGEARLVEDTVLAGAAARARGPSESAQEADARLKELLAQETERVAAAAAFAEVVAPMLSVRLGAPVPARAPAGASRSSGRPEARPLGEERGIADFIDEMLEQERVGAR